MSEENNTVSPFTAIPAKISCKIGKRTRTFDTVEEAQAALTRFEQGPTTQNKGIMAARKAAKVVKEAILAGVQAAYTQDEGVTDQAYKIRCTTICALCVAKPAVYEALTGSPLPVVEIPESGEGDSEGDAENVEQEQSSDAVVESDAVESDVDPLDALGIE